MDQTQKSQKKAELENQTLLAASTKKLRSNKAALVSAALLKETVGIEALGRMFCVMGAPWLDPIIFKSPRPQNLHPYKPERYASEAAIKQGLIAELFYVIPSKFHEPMQGTPWFRETVCCHLYGSG